MKKRLLVLLSVLLVSCSCVGCADYAMTYEQTTSENLSGAEHYVFDLKLENMFGSMILYFRGAMYDLGVKEMINYKYEMTRVENSMTSSKYLLVHLFEDDSYFLISLYYQNNNNIYKLSDEQIASINHDDFKWITGSLVHYAEVNNETK